MCPREVCVPSCVLHTTRVCCRDGAREKNGDRIYVFYERRTAVSCFPGRTQHARFVPTIFMRWTRGGGVLQRRGAGKGRGIDSTEGAEAVAGT